MNKEKAAAKPWQVVVGLIGALIIISLVYKMSVST